MASKHPLRRSCAFCRARKIKCSNETICEACRRQGADCIYDFESPRPKARTLNLDGARPGPAAPNRAPGTHRQRSAAAGDSTSCSPADTVAEEKETLEKNEDVASALERIFYDNFSADVGTRPNPCAYRRAAQSQSLTTTPAGPRNVKYTGILSLVTHDLVGLVTDQLGSLGCHHVEDGGARFFLSCLIRDETQAMFDAAPPGSNPLSEYGPRQQTQLIDVWFSVHPLSFLVSKTLLLRELRDGTQDEVLLAVMLADASFSIGDEVAVARGHVLMRWAADQLRSRPLRPCHQPKNGGTSGDASGRMYGTISTRMFSGISTAQALMLLGWNMLCSFQMRRATCYIALAGRIATDIKEHISSTAAPVTSSRINGIDVFDVEKELLAYLYWTTYSLRLWTFIQLGSGDASALLPTSLTPISLPVTEASSAIIQLDLVSDNFSTLQKQKAVIREMWPLANIASVVAYILALHPRGEDASDDSPMTGSWHEPPLLGSQDVASACREINRVLTESIHVLNQQGAEESSRSLVSLVYHTIAIHFLFPILPAGRGDEGLAADAVERFCTSAQDVLQIFAFVSEQPQDLFSTTPSLRSSFPGIFCLAFDACARALSLIDGKMASGELLMEPPTMHAVEDRLQALAGRLHATCQHDFLNQGRSLRMVRKHLKARARAYTASSSRRGSNSYSNSSGVASPDSTHAPMFRPYASPAVIPASELVRLPAATTAAVDSTSSFLSPMDAASLHSSLPSSASSGRSSTNPFSTVHEMHKPNWQAVDDVFQHVLGPATLSIAAGEHLSVSDLVDLQHAWFPHMPNMLDFGISGPVPGLQWDGPDARGAGAMTTTAAAASDMDSVLYYFEDGRDKPPC